MSQREEILTGYYQGTAHGYGFVTVEGRESDIFVPAAHTGGAMQDDLVEVVYLPGGYGIRSEAHVRRVLKHAVETAVGTYRRKGGHGVVICDNRKLPDLLVEKSDRGGAVDGHKVCVKITSYGDDKRKGRGRGWLPRRQGGHSRDCRGCH